jgi:hypothetical protein
MSSNVSDVDYARMASFLKDESLEKSYEQRLAEFQARVAVKGVNVGADISLGLQLVRLHYHQRFGECDVAKFPRPLKASKEVPPRAEIPRSHRPERLSTGFGGFEPRYVFSSSFSTLTLTHTHTFAVFRRRVCLVLFHVLIFTIAVPVVQIQ